MLPTATRVPCSLTGGIGLLGMSEGAPTTPLWTPSRQLRLGLDDRHKNFVTVPPSFIFPALFPPTYCFFFCLFFAVGVVALLLFYLFLYSSSLQYLPSRFVFGLDLLSCVCITQGLICVCTHPHLEYFLFCFQPSFLPL